MAGGTKRIVFLGPPNSGKGTQALRLAETLGIPAISTGEMLRGSVDSGSMLGTRVRDVMAGGSLVGDDLMVDLVKDRLTQGDAAAGFLLDGYPRTVPQVRTLATILRKRDVALDHVVLIDAPESVLIARALKRGRVDDREDVARKRQAVYVRDTKPLVAIYEDEGLLRRVNGDQTEDEVARDVLKAVGYDARGTA